MSSSLLLSLKARLPAFVRSEGIAGTLARGSTLAFTVNVAGMGVSLLVQMMLGRVLGAADFGVYLYALGWMQIALVAAKLDFDNAAVRFVGAYRGKEDWGALRGFLRYGWGLTAVASIVTMTIGLLGVWLFRGRLTQPQMIASVLVCGMLPFAAPLQFSTFALQGFKRVIQAQAPLLLIRPVAIGAIVVFVHYVLGRKLTGPAVLGINLVVLAGTLAVSGMFLRAAVPSVARDATPRYEVREWWKVATSFMFISASGIVLSQNSDVVLVGSLVGTRAAALYGVCTQLTSFIGFGSVAIAVIAMPMVAELFGKGDLGTLRRMVSVIAWVNVLATIPGLVLLVVFGRWLLQGYGSEFVEAYPVLVVLAASQAFGIMVGGGLGGFLLNMTDHHRTGAAIIGGSALLNIVLSLLLIPRYGLLGAAAATSAAVVVKAVVVTVFVQRKLQINPLPAWRRG